MDSAKTQLADRLKSASNILVTVSRNPSIDQLAACIGLTLLLNKMNKHSVAVFSGQVPSTLEFLKPDATIEKTTDSLRDFIISLDKDKADKLRYKVEDNVVRIFITPYKTSISQEDLEFSQGDFNVDVVVALGVKQQQDLDEAITAHGRILHDATVASLNLSPDSGLGTISWHDPQASSLSELVTDLSQMLGDNILDNQIATALLTGIVAETDRFSNDKTSSQTMNASSVLMAAGANQQLVATKLEEPEKPQPPVNKPGSGKNNAKPGKAKQDPSTLNISHDKEKDKEEEEESPKKIAKPKPTPPEGPALPAVPAPQLPTPQPPIASNLQSGARLLTDDAPSLGGTLNANTKPEGLDPVTDPLSMPQKEENKLFDRPASPPPPPPVQPTPTPPPAPVFTPPPASPAPEPASTPAPTPPAPEPPAEIPPPDDPQTLSQIEKSVDSPHTDTSKLDSARDEVSQALQGSVTPKPAPIQALNAQPLGDKLHEDKPKPTIQPSSSSVLPFDNTPESPDVSPQTDSLDRPSGAPPVPPPFTGNPFDNSDSKTPPL